MGRDDMGRDGMACNQTTWDETGRHEIEGATSKRDEEVKCLSEEAICGRLRSVS